MAPPQDPIARKYYRVAKQRLQEAELVLKIDLPAAAIYLTGYAVECILKALLLVLTPDMRYEPGPGDPKEAERFVTGAKRIVAWADGRM